MVRRRPHPLRLPVLAALLAALALAVLVPAGRAAGTAGGVAPPSAPAPAPAPIGAGPASSGGVRPLALSRRAARTATRAPRRAIHPRRAPRPRRRRAPARRARPTTTTGIPTLGPFRHQGMWIWMLDRSSGGSVPAIVARARAAQIRTLFVKSSDGNTWQSQFTPGLIAAVHAAGLHICAWQYVYGNHPLAEAALGARAAQMGADCLVIDAESEYEGRYAQATTYVDALRQAVGPSYPVGLTTFAYVDFHPAFPYSVFLGPDGAQYDLPQVYWQAIGDSVDTAMAHTYRLNQPYGRPVLPIGQLYGDPPPADIQSFCALAASYGSGGLSWWDWAWATPRGWTAISSGCTGAPAASTARLRAATLGGPDPASVTAGDLVVWAQEHLGVAVTGSLDAATTDALRSLQTAAGLPPTGTLTAATWTALLRRPVRAVRWTAAPAGAARAAAWRAATLAAPLSATLPALGDEPAVAR